MRSRAQFESIIRNALQGVTWQRLKQALLGRELISFGGVVAELTEAQYYNFLKNLSVSTSDYVGLCVIARSQSVYFDQFRTGKAKVVVPAIDSSMAPMTVSLTLGGSLFYNIKTVTVGNEEIQETLVQGTLGSSSLSGTNPGFGYFYKSGVYVENDKSYIKLPENTVADSVRVVFIDSEGSEFPQETSKSIEDTAKVSLFRALDGTLNLVAEDLGEFTDMVARFIVATFEVPKVTTGILDIKGQLLNIDAVYTEGKLSVEAGRDSLKTNLGIRSSIAGELQIREYVNTYPEVKDSSPEVTALNTVTVWVAPKYESNLNYIEENLNDYGELVTRYLVKEGEALRMSVVLTQVVPINGETKSKIVATLSEWVNNNLKFDTIVTPAWLMQPIVDYATKVAVSVVVYEALKDRRMELLSVPTENTIRVLLDDLVVGWDSRGYVRGYIETQQIKNIGVVEVAGSVVVLPKVTKTVLLSTAYQATDLSLQMCSLAKATALKSDENYLVAEFAEGCRVYQMDSRFGEGTYSLTKDPDQFVSHQLPYDDSYIESPVGLLQGTVLVAETSVYKLVFVGGDTVLQKWVVSPQGNVYIQQGANVLVATEIGTNSMIKVSESYLIKVNEAYYTFTDSDLNVKVVEASELSEVVPNIQDFSADSQRVYIRSSLGQGMFDIWKVSLVVLGTAQKYIRLTETPVKVIQNTQIGKLVKGSIALAGDEIYSLQTGLVVKTSNELVPTLGVAGFVDYTKKTITLQTEAFDGADIKYTTAAMKALSKNIYPQIEKIEWDDTDTTV